MTSCVTLRWTLAVVAVAVMAVTSIAGAATTSRPTTTSAPATQQTTRPAAPLAASVPAEAMVYYHCRPRFDNGGGSTTATTVASVLTTAGTLGLLSGEAQLMTDMLAAVPLLGSREHAVVLLDVSSKKVGPTSYRLEQMKVALLIRTGGDARPIIDCIRRLIAKHTNTSVATLEKVTHGRDTFQRLTDSRLPAWAVITFGLVDDLYVVTVGDGDAHERILDAHRGKSARLADDPWFAEAVKQTGADRADVTGMIDFAKTRERLAEVVRGRPDAVLTSMGAIHVQRGLYAQASQGDAWAISAYHAISNGNRLIRLSDPATFPARHKAAVPKGAKHAIVKVNAATVVQRLGDAYLAARSPRSRAKLLQAWARIEATVGVNVMADLVEQLEPWVVVHNYPPHPLNLPMAYTLAIEVKDAGRVRSAVDAILTAWNAELTRPSADPNAPTHEPWFRHDVDGVWYVRMGIAGPAVAVTDRYLVVSWSPAAVRAYLAHLGAGTSQPTTTAPGR